MGVTGLRRECRGLAHPCGRPHVPQSRKGKTNFPQSSGLNDSHKSARTIFWMMGVGSVWCQYFVNGGEFFTNPALEGRDLGDILNALSLTAARS